VRLSTFNLGADSSTASIVFNDEEKNRGYVIKYVTRETPLLTSR
jgi:hypothetical protein